MKKSEIISTFLVNNEVDSLNIVYTNLINNLNFTISNEESNEVKEFLKKLYQKFKEKLKAVNYNKQQFMKKHIEWINQEITIPVNTKNDRKRPYPGRPELPFENKQERAKRAKIHSVCEVVDQNPNLALHTAKSCAMKSGNVDLAKLIDIVINNQNNASDLIKRLQNNEPKKMSPKEALCFLMDGNFSKTQYCMIRNASIKCNSDIYPPYYLITEAKKDCCPPGLTIKGNCAQIPLSNMAYHTVSRIVQLDIEKYETAAKEYSPENFDIELIASYGFDGSSSQSEYNQKKEGSDTSLFASVMIPLRIWNKNNNNEIFWTNPTPQSTRFVRPLRLDYVKESKEYVLKTKAEIDEEIKQISKMVIVLPSGQIVNLYCKFKLTLIDGKILSFITGTSSFQVCPICKCPPSQMNNLDNFKNDKFPPNEEALTYGISNLHLHIRFFEALLHLSYKLPIQDRQCRGAINKFIVSQRKSSIQTKFKTEMHLIVDFPKAGGSGNTNSGNTSRRAFENIEKLSEILEIDIELIYNFKLILTAIAINLPVDPDKFGKLCEETANIWVTKYNWYFMPTSVHKVLIHGKDIMLRSVLPIGMMSEESAESCNKLYRKDRENHCRKTSQEDNLCDLMQRRFCLSDPVLSYVSLQERMKRRIPRILPPKIKEMLVVPLTDPETTEDEVEIIDEDILQNFLSLADNFTLPTDMEDE